jgi:hypothetical protein
MIKRLASELFSLSGILLLLFIGLLLLSLCAAASFLALSLWFFDFIGGL